MPTQEDYDALDIIGSGSFGHIRKVRRKIDGVIMARKEISYRKMEQKERDQLTAEFHILSALKHPNIVEYHHREHIKSEQRLFIYMEYCGGGDLADLVKDLRKKNVSLREEVVWSVLCQLVLALYRCHYGIDPPEHPHSTRNQAPPTTLRGKTVIHRDLKPENVFLDENNFVKLGDFGLSKMLGSEQQLAMTYVGTPLYMSPELVSDTPYNLKTDIWSLGCIIYELCTLKPPFTAKNAHQLVHAIKLGRFDPIPSHYSNELRAVIEQCLRCDPNERPETAQLLFMPSMQNYRRQRDMAWMGKQLSGRETQLGMRETQLVAKERDLVAMERRLIEKDQGLVQKERELMRKEQELMAQEREMKRYLEERSHQLREHIDMEVRHEWKIKAEVEVRQEIERQRMDLNAQFDYEVNQRVESRLIPMLEMELERRIKELNLVPAHTLSTAASAASSTASSSQSTAPTSMTSSFHSPSRSNSCPIMVPVSPDDVDMGDPSPAKRNHHQIFEEEPPVLDLRRSLPLHQTDEHTLSGGEEVSQRHSAPSALANINMDDLYDEGEDNTNNNSFSRSQNTTPVHRASSTGSPYKRETRAGPLRRTQTTTGVYLFPNTNNQKSGNSSQDDFSMAKTAALNSLNQKETYQPVKSSLVELAKQGETELKQQVQKGHSPIPATYDPEKEEMPSPFKSRAKQLF